MDRLEQIKNTVTANGMREWTDERVGQAMREYATEVVRHNLERAVSKAVFAVEDNQMDTGGVVFTDDGNMVRKHVVVLKKSITSLEIELI